MSSAALRSSEYYIKLLVETTKDQGKVLLINATPVQVNAISEISFNLLHLTADLPKSVKTTVRRLKKVLGKLAKKTLSVKTKLKLIKKNVQSILKLIIGIKDSLLQLLQ